MAYLWAFAVVAAICLLQVPAVAWLTRYFKQDDETVEVDPGAPDEDDGGPDLPVGPDAYEAVDGVCTHCGTENDDGFDYCQHCLTPLR